MTIKTEVFETSAGGAAEAREILLGLQTKKVMYLNGPESPGPCMRCLPYHRTVWPAASFSKPTPPLHDHCFCRLVSYRKESGVKRLKQNEFFKSKVSKLSLKNREVLMGKGNARLHRLGIIETENLYSRTQGIKTLTQHLDRLGITQKQFNAMTDGELVKLYNEKVGK